MTGKNLIMLDGAAMRLNYTLNALCDTESATGRAIEDILQFRHVFTDLRALLWCGLTEEYPSLTINHVGDMIDGELKRGGRLENIAKTCLRAFAEQSFFDSAREEPDEID